MIATLEPVDREVFRRYAGISLPRHVSYPMPTWWHSMDETEAAAMHRDADALAVAYDLSIYLHIPFCESLCKFCACNKVIQPKKSSEDADRTEQYVTALCADIARMGERVDGSRLVRQIHYGGGSPTYLTANQTRRIHQTLLKSFQISPDAEVAMEIDPRTVSTERFHLLRELGFNRVSMGIQDFDETVQKHVRRIQPLEMVEEVVATCRSLNFDSINFDLIYGMPYQTVETIREMVRCTIELSPDRIAYYHYAQIPQRIATQRGMDYTKLPDSETKLEMFLTGWNMFEEAGYLFIGLDHFAKPDEALARGLVEGGTHRNFQGMTTGAGLRLLGVGVSSISQLTDIGFIQNVKEIDEYVGLIDQGQMPVQRGKRFTPDDLVRQAVIEQLYSTGQIDTAKIETGFDIEFAGYFERELAIMAELQADGLVVVDATGIQATRPLGRVLLRNIAAVFDAYLDPQSYRKGEKTCYSANA